jgi:hypothetical protein
MKQTAVEWLVENIYTIQVELESGNNDLKNKIEKAKSMEKQQIIDAYNKNKMGRVDYGERHYNETFKK